eukprot:1162059-Pelagomonas_calceolata.AAC.9
MELAEPIYEVPIGATGLQVKVCSLTAAALPVMACCAHLLRERAVSVVIPSFGIHMDRFHGVYVFIHNNQGLLLYPGLPLLGRCQGWKHCHGDQQVGRHVK